MTPRSFSRWSLALSIAMATAVSITIPATAQSARAQQVAEAERTAPADTGVLMRLVTVKVQNMPLRDAVVAVGNAAHVRLLYRKEIIDGLAHTVSLRVTNVPLGRAFEQLFDGTRLMAVPMPRDVVSIELGLGITRSVSGGIKGTVTDAGTKRVMAGAAVVLEGTNYGGRTGDDGVFHLTGVPAGLYRLVVRRIGYVVATVPITVKDDETGRVNVSLTPTATVLNDVVTTATGEQRRFEVGNAVGTIKADSIVPTTLIRNMSDLLQARVPGVVVTNTSGDVGAPSKIRLRGVNSLSLNNDPIVIVDGVRLNAQTTVASLQTNVGSQQMLSQLSNPTGGNYVAPLAPSRLDDLDPNTIESIDVLRGPSASSLYGTDAANGVIVIKTKKGRAGAWRLAVGGDAGTSSIPGRMPDMWWGVARSNQGNTIAQCTLAVGYITVLSGGCTQDTVYSFNPQNFGPMKTMGTGTNRSLNASISGGSDALQQFLSARVSSDVGMSKMSDVERRLITQLWNAPAPNWMVHPNSERDVDGSSRTTFNVAQNADVSLSTAGYYRDVLNGGNGMQSVYYNVGVSPADTLSFLPSESQRTRSSSTLKRGTLAATGDYRPRNWLSFTGTGGGDFGLRLDQADLQAQYCTLILQIVQTGITTCPSGHTERRDETFVTTANGSANLSFTPLSWLNLRTALGEQYSHTNFSSTQVGNSDPNYCPLAFGTTLLTPMPVCQSYDMQQYAVQESRDEAATAGVYVEETINALGLYYTFGVRQDVASAFGGQVAKSPPNYPKFNFSYPLSDQSFFPKQSLVSSLRLRLAYGQSGNQASQTAVLNNYALNTVTRSGSTISNPSLTVTSLGSTKLRPEKGTEWEGGFDISFFENERVHTELTLYRKYTRDAIAPFSLAPSLGNYGQYYNLGNVENRGLELGLTAKLIDSRLVTWDLNLNATKNSNKLVHKAPSLDVNGPLNTQFREGYPLYGYWGVPVESYADVNGNGILEQNEIIFGQQQYMGAPYPKGDVVYNSTVSLWNGALRLAAVVDQLIGQTTQLKVQCNDACFFPRAAVDRTAPLAEQAAYIQAVQNNNSYIGTSSSVRVNELSATYQLPLSIVRRLHAESFGITLAGRNVALWSSYVGKDPDVDTSGLLGEATMDNSLGTPQPRSWTLRFNLGL